MSTPSRSESAINAALAGSLPAALRADLGGLLALAQTSRHVFASPIGPLSLGGQPVYLPRFVFFGPQACDDSWRLALLAGFDHRDTRSTGALLSLVAHLASDSETGHGLNLSVFPLVDAGGPSHLGPPRDLSAAHWGRGAPPEIELLERDARQRGYHGFVRVETASSEEELVVIRVRGPFAHAASPDMELVTSEETRSFPVRFEAVPGGTSPADGPLSVADDLPLTPFELTLRLPASWPDAEYRGAAVTLIERFLRRYRAFQAYGQHL